MINPQSWNRYAYVMNSPLVQVDPSGLACNAVVRNLTGGGCDLSVILFGSSFGSNWNEFDIMNIRTITPNSTYIPPSYWSTTTTIFDSEGNQIGDPLYSFGVQTGGWQNLGNGLDVVNITSSAANNGGIWGDITNWFRTAKFLGVGGSLWIAHPKIPVGWSPGLTFVSDGTNLHGCTSLLAGGVGAKVPGGSAGLLFGDPSKALAIVQGWSVTVNANLPLPIPLGVQVVSSSAGTLAGPTIGTPGVSLQVGYSSCN